MTGALLEVSDLTKHFPVTGGFLGTRSRGAVQAVDGISFALQPGRTLALVGESGCGKTTTAKLVLRLHRPTRGTVTLEGRDVHSLAGDELVWLRRSVQAVFQDPWSSLSPRMRVGDIVAEPLVVNSKLSRSEVRQRVASMLERVGLQPWQARLFPHEFSGGQRQRIALAMALITNPRLVVLDEPVSALDVSVQAQVMNLLRDLQDELQTSYLLITHDLATVRFVADDVAVMYLGKIVETASAEELLDNPKHPYTQALFAAELPHHPAQRRHEVPVRGELPSPLNPPEGCRFRTRCPFAMDVCSEPPRTTQFPGGHEVACHLF
jgi:oligopeptide/dipeptide ABC transporter ATP-binding protein